MKKSKSLFHIEASENTVTMTNSTYGFLERLSELISLLKSYPIADFSSVENLSNSLEGVLLYRTREFLKKVKEKDQSLIEGILDKWTLDNVTLWSSVNLFPSLKKEVKDLGDFSKIQWFALGKEGFMEKLEDNLISYVNERYLLKPLKYDKNLHSYLDPFFTLLKKRLKQRYKKIHTKAIKVLRNHKENKSLSNEEKWRHIVYFFAYITKTDMVSMVSEGKGWATLKTEDLEERLVSLISFHMTSNSGSFDFATMMPILEESIEDLVEEIITQLEQNAIEVFNTFMDAIDTFSIDSVNAQNYSSNEPLNALLKALESRNYKYISLSESKCLIREYILERIFSTRVLGFKRGFIPKKIEEKFKSEYIQKIIDIFETIVRRKIEDIKKETDTLRWLSENARLLERYSEVVKRSLSFLEREVKRVEESNAPTEKIYDDYHTLLEEVDQTYEELEKNKLSLIDFNPKFTSVLWDSLQKEERVRLLECFPYKYLVPIIPFRALPKEVSEDILAKAKEEKVDTSDWETYGSKFALNYPENIPERYNQDYVIKKGEEIARIGRERLMDFISNRDWEALRDEEETQRDIPDFIVGGIEDIEKLSYGIFLKSEGSKPLDFLGLWLTQIPRRDLYDRLSGRRFYEIQTILRGRGFLRPNEKERKAKDDLLSYFQKVSEFFNKKRKGLAKRIEKRMKRDLNGARERLNSFEKQIKGSIELSDLFTLRTLAYDDLVERKEVMERVEKNLARLKKLKIENIKLQYLRDFRISTIQENNREIEEILDYLDQFNIYAEFSIDSLRDVFIDISSLCSGVSETLQILLRNEDDDKIFIISRDPNVDPRPQIAIGEIVFKDKKDYIYRDLNLIIDTESLDTLLSPEIEEIKGAKDNNLIFLEKNLLLSIIPSQNAPIFRGSLKYESVRKQRVSELMGQVDTIKKKLLTEKDKDIRINFPLKDYRYFFKDMTNSDTGAQINREKSKTILFSSEGKLIIVIYDDSLYSGFRWDEEGYLIPPHNSWGGGESQTYSDRGFIRYVIDVKLKSPLSRKFVFPTQTLESALSKWVDDMIERLSERKHKEMTKNEGENISEEFIHYYEKVIPETTRTGAENVFWKGKMTKGFKDDLRRFTKGSGDLRRTDLWWSMVVSMEFILSEKGFLKIIPSLKYSNSMDVELLLGIASKEENTEEIKKILKKAGKMNDFLTLIIKQQKVKTTSLAKSLNIDINQRLIETSKGYSTLLQEKSEDYLMGNYTYPELVNMSTALSYHLNLIGRLRDFKNLKSLYRALEGTLPEKLKDLIKTYIERPSKSFDYWKDLKSILNEMILLDPADLSESTFEPLLEINKLIAHSKEEVGFIINKNENLEKATNYITSFKRFLKGDSSFDDKVALTCITIFIKQFLYSQQIKDLNQFHHYRQIKDLKKRFDVGSDLNTFKKLYEEEKREKYETKIKEILKKLKTEKFINALKKLIKTSQMYPIIMKGEKNE
jgi:hypothetical protein